MKMNICGNEVEVEMINPLWPSTKAQHDTDRTAAKKKPPYRAPFDEFKHNKDVLYFNRTPQVVYLNVYNVVSANGFLECLGFGLYHTSVGVYGMEFSYGGHDEALSGIVVVE